MLGKAILMSAVVAVPATIALQMHASSNSQSIKHAPLYATDEIGSKNWAGYVDIAKPGQTFHSVTGTWQVPAIEGEDQSAAAQWIGLGGVQSKDLLQMGTVETMDNGQAENVLFWEKLPNAANDWLTLPAGATVSASIAPVSANSNTFLLKAVVSDNGQTQTYTKEVEVSPAYQEAMGTSADWISEDPSDVSLNLIPLAQMGTIRYTNATANGLPILQSDASTEPMALVGTDGQTVLVQPSQLYQGDTSFYTSDTGNSGATTVPQITVVQQVPTGPFPSSDSSEAWQQWQQMQNQLQQQLKQAFGNPNGSWNSLLPSNGSSWIQLQQQWVAQLQQAEQQLQSLLSNNNWGAFGNLTNAGTHSNYSSWNPLQLLSQHVHTHVVHNQQGNWQWTIQWTAW